MNRQSPVEQQFEWLHRTLNALQDQGCASARADLEAWAESVIGSSVDSPAESRPEDQPRVPDGLQQVMERGSLLLFP